MQPLIHVSLHSNLLCLEQIMEHYNAKIQISLILEAQAEDIAASIACSAPQNEIIALEKTYYLGLKAIKDLDNQLKVIDPSKIVLAILN
jgi:hypothetical protein